MKYLILLSLFISQPILAGWSHQKDIDFGDHPESVLSYGRSLYVSDMGKVTGPEKNGDGNLVKMNMAGVIDQKFKIDHKLNSPMGMAVAGNTLWVTDIDRVVGFDKFTGKKVSEFSFQRQRATFLNDVIAVNDYKLIISGTNSEKLFLLDIEARKIKKIRFSSDDFQPNGLAYDIEKNILYSAGNHKHQVGREGNGYVLAIQLNEKHRRGKVLWEKNVGHFLDGIVISGDSLLISDWGEVDFTNNQTETGELIKLDILSGDQSRRSSLNTPGFADFDLIMQDMLVTPDLLNGRIRYFTR